MATIRKTIINVGENVEKTESSYTGSGKVKWYGCFGKQFSSFLKSYTELPYDPETALKYRYILKRNDNICPYKCS